MTSKRVSFRSGLVAYKRRFDSKMDAIVTSLDQLETRANSIFAAKKLNVSLQLRDLTNRLLNEEEKQNGGVRPSEEDSYDGADQYEDDGLDAVESEAWIEWMESTLPLWLFGDEKRPKRINNWLAESGFDEIDCVVAVISALCVEGNSKDTEFCEECERKFVVKLFSGVECTQEIKKHLEKMCSYLKRGGEVTEKRTSKYTKDFLLLVSRDPLFGPLEENSDSAESGLAATLEKEILKKRKAVASDDNDSEGTAKKARTE